MRRQLAWGDTRQSASNERRISPNRTLSLVLAGRSSAFASQVRPGAHLEGYVETLKAPLAAAEAVGGAGDCQGGEGRHPVRGSRGRATFALMAVAHGLRLAFPAAFPSTTPPRLFDRLSYRLKTSPSRNPAKPSISIAKFEASEVRAAGNGDTRTLKAVASGEAWACGAAGG